MAPYSIVVVTWECAEHLRVLVDSINRHLSGDHELIVVDNASSDDPEEAVGRREGANRFIALERNLGFGAAANAGVEAAAHDGVVLLNPDTVLLDASLDDLVELGLDRRGLAGPQLLNPDGSAQPSASGPPVGMWPWVGAVLPGGLQPRALLARTEPWRLRSTAQVAWLTGACIAAPADTLRALGPFDPAIHLYGEDMDLGLRADRAGVRSFFCPEVCRIVHHSGASATLRYPDGPADEVAKARRNVLGRLYGARRERRAGLALRLNLRLRIIVKRALRRDATRDRLTLQAARRAASI